MKVQSISSAYTPDVELKLIRPDVNALDPLKDFPVKVIEHSRFYLIDGVYWWLHETSVDTKGIFLVFGRHKTIPYLKAE